MVSIEVRSDKIISNLTYLFCSRSDSLGRPLVLYFCNSPGGRPLSWLRGRPRRESYGNKGQKTTFGRPKVLSLKTKESQTGFDSVAWARKASMVIEMMAKLDISRLDTRCWPMKVCWRKAKEQCHFWFEK